MRRDRAAAEEQGRRAERIAAWYLRLCGWRILAQRCRVHGGEVDLVARRGRTVAFVEVKWRARAEHRADAIDGWRLRRVAVAAERLAPRFVRAGDNVRLDAILLAPGRWPQHRKGLWADR